MLRTLNAAARYVNQGGNKKRPGAFAIYLEPRRRKVRLSPLSVIIPD